MSGAGSESVLTKPDKKEDPSAILWGNASQIFVNMDRTLPIDSNRTWDSPLILDVAVIALFNISTATPTGWKAGSSKRITKKAKETTAEESQADLALQAEYVSEIKQAQEAAEKAKTKGEQAAVDMF